APAPLSARALARRKCRHLRHSRRHCQVPPPLRSHHPAQIPQCRKETSMSSEHQQPNSESPIGEIAFVQQALAAADRSERSSRIIIAVLAILAVIVFVWMHLHMFPTASLAGLLQTILRVDLFFLVLIFALTMYLRQVMNRNTRTILRALANTRSR